MDSISYSSKETEVVESGIVEIKKVLLNGSEKEKRQLLFCLDRYLDPWFGYQLSYEKKSLTYYKNY